MHCEVTLGSGRVTQWQVLMVVKLETSPREPLRPLNSVVHGSQGPLQTHLTCIALSGFFIPDTCSLVHILLTFSYY